MYGADKMSFWNDKEAKGLFQEFPLYNVFIGKAGINRLKNTDLLHELPFYDKLRIAKISQAFKRYARSYKTEIIDPKYPLVQLETSKSSTSDLFKDLLYEIKVFEYQIKVKVLLSKHKRNVTEFAPVYFNSTTKTVIMINICLRNPLKKLYIKLMVALMKNLVG